VQKSNLEMNLEVYSQLGERWYHAVDDPIALLRAESRMRNPWIAETLLRELGVTAESVRILDIGCGGGFLTNPLSMQGFCVTGVDQSAEALDVARRYDQSGKVSYVHADAFCLPFADESFDAVTAMDFLEHVQDPGRAIAEMARVLRPGGLWFFHTFNRTWISKWVAIWAVERFVANVPEGLHLHEWFIRPQELCQFAEQAGIQVQKCLGIRPALGIEGIKNLWGIARSGCVPRDFRFVESGSLQVGYMGFGIRTS